MVVDPNPTVALKGIDKLRAAGVEVIVGVEWELYRNLDVAYIHHMLAGKPFVTLRSISCHSLSRLFMRHLKVFCEILLCIVNGVAY